MRGSPGELREVVVPLMMPSQLQTLRSWGDVLERMATSIALVGICVLIVCSVVLRYLFSSGIVWGEEVSRGLFISMTYLAISRADKAGLHFRVTILQERIPTLRPYLELCVSIIQLLLLCYLTYLAATLVLFVKEMGQRLPAADLPAYYFYVPIALGLALGSIRSAEQVINRSAVILAKT